MNLLSLTLLAVAANPIAAPYEEPKPIAFAYAGEIKLEATPVHTAKPTVKPVVLNHTWNQHGCLCAEMCVGQHLRNAHGKTYDGLDDIGYRNWSRYHRGLHNRGTVVEKSSQARTNAAHPYRVPVQQTRQRRGLICRLRGG